MSSDDPFTDIWKSAERMLSRPKFVFTFIISLAIVYSHVFDNSNSFFDVLLPATSTNYIIVYLRQDLTKIAGILFMIPAALDAPADRRQLVLLASIVFVLLTATMTLWEYFILSLFLDIWNHVQLPLTHVIMVGAVALVAQMNWLSNPLFPTTPGTGSPTTATTPVPAPG